VQAELARKVCELVAGISETDGEFHLDEGALLRRVMTRLGLSAHGDEPIMPTLKGEDAARAIGALPEAVRFEAFELLIDAAIVDGRVVPAERQYLEAVASALGATPAQLERQLEQRLSQR
jgi:tellurite resistance protein